MSKLFYLTSIPIRPSLNSRSALSRTRLIPSSLLSSSSFTVNTHTQALQFLKGALKSFKGSNPVRSICLSSLHPPYSKQTFRFASHKLLTHSSLNSSLHPSKRRSSVPSSSNQLLPLPLISRNQSSLSSSFVSSDASSPTSNQASFYPRPVPADSFAFFRIQVASPPSAEPINIVRPRFHSACISPLHTALFSLF